MTLSELTPREQRWLEEQGWESMQIARLSCYRWSLWHYGRAHNLLETPDVLRRRVVAHAVERHA